VTFGACGNARRKAPLHLYRSQWEWVVHAVSSSLEAMGIEQYLLAFLFLFSYAFALSEFTGARGRLYAALTALACAIAFAARTDPWEHGVLVVAFALVAMGLFTGTAWGLWALLARFESPAGAPRAVPLRRRSADVSSPAPVVPAPSAHVPLQRLAPVTAQDARGLDQHR